MKELEEKITVAMAEKTGKTETKTAAPAAPTAPVEEAEEPRRRKKVNIDIAVDE